MPLETNDPYIYVDPMTGRVFEFHMQPILACATLSWSDDAGQTWTSNPVGCGPTGAWDHQTMVAAKPVGVTTRGYPNVLVQCVNAVYAEMCSRSLDGGASWEPAVVAYPNDAAARKGSTCGTQTGHLAAAPDGTLYLPTSDCGTFPTVAVSRDSGATWTRVKVANMAMPFDDPAVAVDGSGNVYATWYDNVGQLWFAVSRDAGRTYSAPVKAASSAITAGKLSMVVGDDGKIAVAHVSTAGIPGQWANRSKLSADDQKAVRWGAFMTVSTDALSENPTFQTLEVTGTDPLMNTLAACGPAARCAYIVDFIGSAITPDGRPFGAFVDGCTQTCAKSVGATNNEPGNQGKGLVASLDVDLCAAQCPRLGMPAAGAPTATAEAAAAVAAAPAPVVPAFPASVLEAARLKAIADRQRLGATGVATPMGLRG
jgi:photosystem II stability/assembly factor-like uncharacterized protein